MPLGSGPNPAAAHQMPPGRSPPSSAASPSSSSSAVSAPNQLGFELMNQRQQQLVYRQALQALQQNHHQQQPQLKKAESEQSHLPYQVGGTYGVSGAGFPANSAVQSSQLSKKYGNILCQPGALQLHEESQNKGLGTGQEMQNSIHQAYLQFVLQSAQQKSHGNFVLPQQGKTNMVGQSGRDQDMIMNKLKMHELMSQASGKSQMPMFKRAVEQFTNAEKQMEQGHINHDQRNDLKPFPADAHLNSANAIRPVQSLQPQGNAHSFTSNQLAMAQMQAMQAWAMEHNVDLSVPANLNLIAQILPLLQSNKVAAGQKPTETSVSIQQSLPTSKQQVMQSPVGSDSSAHGNSTSDLPGQCSSLKLCQTLPLSSNRAGDTTSINTSTCNMKQQQVAENSSWVSQNERAAQPPMLSCSGAQDTHLANLSGSINQTLEKSNYNSISAGNKMQTQSLKPLLQVNQSVPLLATPANNSAGTQIPTSTGSAQTQKEYFGFTKKQLHVLKAQILAFRRLKRGERSLPPEVLQAIADSTSDHQPFHGPSQSENVNYDLTKADNSSNNKHRMIVESHNQTQKSTPATKRHTQMKEEPFSGEEKTAFASQMQVSVDLEKDPGDADSIGRLEESSSAIKSEQESEKGSQNSSSKGDCHADKGKVTHMDGGGSMVPRHAKTPAQTNTTTPSRDGVSKKYHGPIFDFPSFTRKPLGSTTTIYSSNLTLAYNVKDLLYEEGKFVLTKKRAENLKKIGWLLAFNLERKIINPDIVVQLQIEEKKLKLFDLQSRLRDEIEHQQEEIMAMSDRQYCKFVRQCEQQRVELARQVQQLQRALRDKLLKTVFQWRKKHLASHWAIRDARTTRNRGIAKYHERMLSEFSKRMDEDKNKRMDALKNNDADRYCEMLLEQQTSIQGDAAQCYAVLSSFLTQTEEYLHKLRGKITAAKSSQEVEEAAAAAAAAARAQGLSSEEVRAAAACAREEVMIRNRFSEMNAQKDSSVIRYYNLAHAVIERVVSQPSMLRAGTLRDYQLVGLQWMLFLYNNKLNGILADEMGLGKTVQVMALIAYLMEFKGNYGPHLIIVPNAVLVNWKSELLNWLPSISCIFYVGGKDERSKLFSQEICAVKFNVLVTTYEFIMYDHSKLSKIDWKYIIIDEAQRMKDRESVLARDLDRYHCQRRLLLTGTPLQNDLKELWSLLNLLLPEVFDNHKAFHDWFSKPFQKDGPHNEEEDEWLETEKKVIIIHRLHQILEPFMLRRRLEDVESSLPHKNSIVVRCRMSAIQGAIYDWIKSTGTIRVDHGDEMQHVQKNPLYQVKTYKNLNNKCMELRKVCNHPFLNYPCLSNYSKDFIVRSCGKLWVLDRILIKLQRAGHRVLLFSTMTKLLDILEEYLQWRRLMYQRIDGTTCLEDQESAIVDFNSPDSECFIFLLSIRAAGRGLNLQTADTVVIYDPDPNSQNEEQAVARAHRIGQKSEVKVIYLEAVVDKILSYQKEDELSNGVAGNSDDDLAGKDRYMGSIESLIRNNIQQYKIDMADEVINAGCFDQRTTHEERWMTLEMLLRDEERYQENVHDVPSMQEVNRMIARSEEEVELFDQMDEDLDWTADMVKDSELPKWLRVSSSELDAATTSLSKKPLKNILSGNIVSEPCAVVSDPSVSKMERRRGFPGKNYPIYQELDGEDGEDSDIDSEERNTSEEEKEVGEFNDQGFIDVVDVLPSHKFQVTQEMSHEKGGYEFSQMMIHHSTNSSSGSHRLLQHKNPVLSSQKFGSLSLLDARPCLPSKKMSEELEEGEIAVSGDSHLDLQQSGSWLHDHEDGEEDQQVLQPKITRKRSVRIRPRYNVQKNGKNTDIAKVPECASRWFQLGDEYAMPLRTGKLESFSHPDLGKRHTTSSSWKHEHSTPSRKMSPMQTGRLSYFSGSAEDGNKHSREIWHSKVNNSGRPIQMGAKMSDITQRKCKNVISKLQMRIHKDGTQIVPILYDWWRKNERSSFATNATGGKLLDLQIIEQRVDNLQYSGVTEFITDVQLMLKSVVRHCNYSYEVKCEAERLQALFFNIMKIAFPHSDFQQARNAVTFSNPRRAATSPGGPSQKLTNKIKQHTPILAPTRTSSHVATHMNDEWSAKSTPSKQQKELRLVSGSWTEKAPECSQYVPHPGDLVVCKKRRKERDKSSVNQRIGPRSPSEPSHLGGLSSGPSSSINQNSNFSILRNSNSADQAKHASSLPPREMQQSDDRLGASRSIADVQWVKPVKRMRTDSCKRRPSHM